jgi:ADP-heptose:LPS heptosyltransferase
MKTVVFSPYSSKLRCGKPNAKNYPYWKGLLSLLKSKGFYTIQLGVTGEEKIDGADEFKQNLSFDEIEKLVTRDETLIFSVDSFLPHLCRNIGRACIVLWGKSDPKIFGYEENVNLLKDRKYLRNRHDQWVYWEDVPFDADAFMSPEEVMKNLKSFVDEILQ